VTGWVATRRSTAPRVRRRPVRVGNSGSSGISSVPAAREARLRDELLSEALTGEASSRT
jgi:hypothetical protein